MKLVTYLRDGNEQLACYVDGYLYDLEELHPDLPNSMSMLLNYWEELLPMAQIAEQAVHEGRIGKARGIKYEEVKLLAPVPFATSVRNAAAFRPIVTADGQITTAKGVAAFEEHPPFNFGNHHSIQGAGTLQCMPDHFRKLDFELACAVVISKSGRNIAAELADDYIAGLMIMNNLSAHQLQQDEMQTLSGPDKVKDFATITGPWLVTLDELEQFEIPAKEGHVGKSWNLPMKCSVNGDLVCEGNVGDMEWTFAEIIERAAYGSTLFAGDVIGSGPVATGSFPDLNNKGKLTDANYSEQWLQPGDIVSLEIHELGKLENTLEKDDSEFSLLKEKENL